MAFRSPYLKAKSANPNEKASLNICTPSDNKATFAIITAFMIVELIGGYFANSLALLSDGVHMLSDAFSLGLALFAFKYGERNATTEMTFGSNTNYEKQYTIK